MLGKKQSTLIEEYERKISDIIERYEKEIKAGAGMRGEDQNYDRIIFSLQTKINSLVEENERLGLIIKRNQQISDPLEASLRRSLGVTEMRSSHLSPYRKRNIFDN